MPDTIYHVRSKITGARVIIGLTDRELATSECERLNTEARTGIRAAYGEGEDRVEAQRLVAGDSGIAEHREHGMPAEHVGRILHDGQIMEYELEVEARMTPDELERLHAQMRASLQHPA
jgi:hypothetical protein